MLLEVLEHASGKDRYQLLPLLARKLDRRGPRCHGQRFFLSPNPKYRMLTNRRNPDNSAVRTAIHDHRLLVHKKAISEINGSSLQLLSHDGGGSVAVCKIGILDRKLRLAEVDRKSLFH
jgi:hypothetical protein